MVHRDIKPANLLLDGAGHLWVVDFGLARFHNDAGLTVTGDLVGTLRYMSPEQALARRAVIDHRTDVYALGATLYELLALAPAFPGDDRQDVLRRIAEEEPPAPRRLDPAIPADLETIVLKAMAKEPSERYATAQELADDLRRFLDDRPIVARRPTLAQRARRWARRHRPLVLSLGAASALLLAGLVVGLMGYAVEKDRLAREKDLTKKEAEARLYDTLLKHAHAVRLARQPGYRAVVWDDLGQAAKLDVPGKDSGAIAAEALACLGDPVGLDPVQTPDASRQAPAPLPAGFQAWLEGRGLAGKGHTAAVPGGKFAAWADGGVVELRLADGTPFGLPARSPFGSVYDLAFDRDQTCLAAGCEEGFAVWDVPGGALRSLVRSGNVCSVALHPSGRLLATVGRQVELWSCASGRLVASLPAPATGTKVEFSADGQLLLATVGGKAVVGWPVSDTPEKRRFHGHRGGVPCVALSPDGRLLASASKDQTVKVWDAGSGRLLHTGQGHAAPIEAVAFSPDGRLLATGDFVGDVRLWDAESGKQLARVFSPPRPPPGEPAPPGQVWRLQFGGAGTWLAAGGHQGVAVWDIRPQAGGVDVRQRVALPVRKVFDLAVHPGGSALAFLAEGQAGEAAQLYRYDLGEKGDPQPLGVAARLQIRGLNFDTSGRLLTFVTPEGRLGRWDWVKRVALPGAGQPAFQVALAPGGRWAATSSPERGVVICGLDGGGRVLALPAEESDVWCLAWAPDGQRLAVGLSDGGVAAWDLGQVRDRLAEFGIAVPLPLPAGGAAPAERGE